MNINIRVVFCVVSSRVGLVGVIKDIDWVMYFWMMERIEWEVIEW